MTTGAHPDAVLYSEDGVLPERAAVEHFAGSEKLMRKALALQAERGPVFDITLDCEDGAAAGAERDHAELVAALIMSPENRFNRVGARIHDITHSAWRTDLEQIVGLAGTRLAYLVLPKARGVSDVERVIAILREVEARGGLTREIPLHVILETHGALHQAWEIAALPGIETLDFGLMDFVSAHHGALDSAAMRSPGQFEHPLVVSAKIQTVRAALAHAVLPSHNVCIELRDQAIIESDARRAREEFGFLRMWSIHPDQIDPILRGMRPAAAEVEMAGEIILAAQDADWAPTRHQDRLHDRASYRYFWNVLKRAHSTGITLQDEVLNRLFA
ncbi:aldolase/citrate lyase family protein [Uliginosibacterium sp. 31-16]|uniref:HpcH/HpaI aldolase/citrate lyase family protein n=1 Tax=Uliginosibacterium sp. 31-16 TaxID=3068315 RepID=UPI00273F7DF8|nr:aldolase/citrate lyase family protein [Uliginosibacterium sp. 31-16]MDP5240434.1 aldolase/citrate lyase family protein [Uliginosibacterium sp. 31-16]